jgi:hypothetical protein
MSGTSFRMIVDLANCLPSHLYTLWFFGATESMDDPAFNLNTAFANRLVGAVGGGVPAVVVTNATGQGRLDRYIDPQVWFKAGTSCTPVGCIAHSGSKVWPAIPDATRPPTIIVGLFYHVTGQTNGNAGNCPLKSDGTCAMAADCPAAVTAPFPELIVAPGRGGVDGAFAEFTSIRESQLQPF